MFRSLRARLLLSYVVLIVVCLVLVGLAALVLLRDYQRNLAYSHLADRSGLVSQLAAAAIRRGTPPQEIVDRLQLQVNRGDGPSIRLLLLDAAGNVVASSDSRLHGEHFENLAVGPGLPLGWMVRDVYRLDNGAPWLYVAEAVRTPSAEGRMEPTHVVLLAEPYRPVRYALGDLLPRLIGVGAIALALSIVLAGVLAYSIARPLGRIAEAAEKVAAGDYGRQLQISSPIEVARLAASFNIMTRQVQTTLQSQQDLVANVSHDLKTPLTSIQGFSQALLDGTARDEPARQRAAAVIHQEASRMRRLVDDLLDLAQLEAGQVVLAREPVDLGEVLQECAGRFAPQLEQGPIELLVEVPEGLPAVLGDAARLGQVFGNLVDNALKHASGAQEGARVVLGAEVRGELVACLVTDNGPGIPPEELPRIFERFYQVDKSRARQSGAASPAKSGAGLGLAIAHEIVLAHGGQILAESVEGLGTRFTVVLPAYHG